MADDKKHVYDESKVKTFSKDNANAFQFSVGLNGVGTKAVNALSKEFRVRIRGWLREVARQHPA